MEENLKEYMEELKELSPKHFRQYITKDFAKALYEVREDPQLLDELRQSLITYAGVLQDGKYRVSNYVNAVRYISYKNMGFKNIDSYKLTFPDRYKHYMEKGGKDMVHKIVNIYNTGSLVREITKRTLVPSYIMYADVRREAIMRQVDLMHNARSEAVQQKAAEALLKITQEPEEMNITMDIKTPETNKIEEYKAALKFMAEQQKRMIESGHDTKQIINVKLGQNEQEES